MLNKSYASQEAIPENLRGAYIQKGSEWVLDDLSQDHPVVTHNKQLQTELSTEKGKVTRLTNEKTALEGNVLPAGHKAVPEADAELIDVVKPHGDKKAVKTLLDEHATLKEEKAQREAEGALKKAAELAGYDNPAAFVAAAQAQKLAVTFKEETVDGKKVEKPFVGDKPLTEFVEATPGLKALEIAFKTKPVVTAPTTEGGSGNRPAAAGANGDKGGGDKQTYRFQEPGDVKWD